MKKLLALTIIFGTFLGCKKSSVSEPPTGVISEIVPVKIIVNISIPTDVPSSAIGQLKVISSFYEISVPGQKNTSAKIDVIAGSVQMITLENKGLPFMFSLAINKNKDETININSETTTVGLVFLHRLFIGNDPKKATVIVEKIKSSTSFPRLLDEVTKLLIQGSLRNQTPYIEVDKLQNYKRVVAETLEQLNDNKDIEKSGLQIIESKRIGNEMRFKIRNYKKRFSTIYAFKYNNGQLTPTNIKADGSVLGYGPFEWVSSGSFSWVEAWRQIFTLSVKEQIIEDSPEFIVDATNAEKIFIKCYGLGMSDGTFPAFGSESFERGAGALAMTGVFDYTLPIVSIASGISDFPSKGNLLRGRPNDDPLMKLVKNYGISLAKNKLLSDKLATASYSFKKWDLLEAFIESIKDYILDPENVKLYFEIAKKYTVMTVSQESILKKGIDYLRIGTAADITETSVKLGEAVYATVSTKWETEFIIDNKGINITPSTDGLIAYYPFNENSSDESGNSNHGTVFGATLTTDRHENSNKAYSFDGVDDYIVAANSTSLDIQGNEMSISMWINYENDVSDPNHFGLSKGGVHVGNGYELLIRGSYGGDNGVVSFNYEHGTDWDITLYSNANSYRGQWIHLVAVLKSGVGKLYLNNQEVSLNTEQPFNLLSSNSQLFIGRRNPDNIWATYLKGKVDDIRIYNRALSENEIKVLFLE